MVETKRRVNIEGLLVQGWSILNGVAYWEGRGVKCWEGEGGKMLGGGVGWRVLGG